MKCVRCGTEFDNPVPEVTNPAGNTEIACNGWCPACNAFAMAIAFRFSSAYLPESGNAGEIRDPLRGGKHHAC